MDRIGYQIENHFAVSILRNYKHPDAKTALEEWYEKAESAEWDNFAQVRALFNSADMVGNKRIVFNLNYS